MIPTSEVELMVGQRVDLPTGRKGRVVKFDENRVGVVFENEADDLVKPLKRQHLKWTGNYWLYGPRPWIVEVEEWDGDSWVAQIHDTQQEFTVSGPDADAIIGRKFRGKGHVTLFKIHSVELKLDALEFVRGLDRDLDCSRGLFFDLFNLEMSNVMRDFNFTDEHKIQLVLAFGSAWRSVFPEPIWWSMGGEGETWCSNCVKPVGRCACE
jgi:hypothetical protein